jgi:hypothetical protein
MGCPPGIAFGDPEGRLVRPGNDDGGEGRRAGILYLALTISALFFRGFPPFQGKNAGPYPKKSANVP